MSNGRLATMSRPFTGRHMTLILVAFFGTVIAVNVFMAYHALKGFGGTVVDNSYVASQKYNDWLRKARAQAALGWTVETARNADGKLVVTARGRDGAPLAGHAMAVLEHPLGQLANVPVALSGAGPWVSLTPVPAGRWRLRLMLDVDGHRAPYLIDLP